MIECLSCHTESLYILELCVLQLHLKTVCNSNKSLYVYTCFRGLIFFIWLTLFTVLFDLVMIQLFAVSETTVYMKLAVFFITCLSDLFYFAYSTSLSRQMVVLDLFYFCIIYLI